MTGMANSPSNSRPTQFLDEQEIEFPLTNPNVRTMSRKTGQMPRGACSSGVTTCSRLVIGMVAPSTYVNVFRCCGCGGATSDAAAATSSREGPNVRSTTTTGDGGAGRIVPTAVVVAVVVAVLGLWRGMLGIVGGGTGPPRSGCAADGHELLTVEGRRPRSWTASSTGRGRADAARARVEPTRSGDLRFGVAKPHDDDPPRTLPRG